MFQPLKLVIALMFKWCPRLKLVKSWQIWLCCLEKPMFVGVHSCKVPKNEQFPHLHAQWNSPWEFPWFWLVLRPTKKAVLDPVRNYSEIEPLTSAKLKKHWKGKKIHSKSMKIHPKIVKRQVKSSNSQCVPPVSSHQRVSTWFRKDATNNGVSFAGVAPLRSAPREILWD